MLYELNSEAAYRLEPQSESLLEMFYGSNKYPKDVPASKLVRSDGNYKSIFGTVQRASKWLLFTVERQTTNDGHSYNKLVIKYGLGVFNNNFTDPNALPISRWEPTDKPRYINLLQLPVVYWSQDLIDKMVIVMQTKLEGQLSEIGITDSTVNKALNNIYTLIKTRMMTMEAGTEYYHACSYVKDRFKNKKALTLRYMSKEVKITSDTKFTPKELQNLYSTVTPAVKVNKWLLDGLRLRDDIESGKDNRIKMIHWHFLLLNATALRVGDACKILWKNVKLDKYTDTYYIDIEQSKTDKAHRVTFPKSLRPHIDEWLEVAKLVEAKSGRKVGDQHLFYMEHSLERYKELVIAFLNKYIIENQKSVIRQEHSVAGKIITKTWTRAEYFAKNKTHRSGTAQALLASGASEEDVANVLGHTGTSNVKKYAKFEIRNRNSYVNAQRIDDMIMGAQAGTKVLQDAATMTVIHGAPNMSAIQAMINEAAKKAVQTILKNAPKPTEDQEVEIIQTPKGTVTKYEYVHLMENTVQLPRTTIELEKQEKRVAKAQKALTGKKKVRKENIARMTDEEVEQYTKNTRRINRRYTSVQTRIERQEEKVKQAIAQKKKEEAQAKIEEKSVKLLMEADKEREHKEQMKALTESVRAKYADFDVDTITTYDDAQKALLEVLSSLEYEGRTTVMTKLIMRKNKLASLPR